MWPARLARGMLPWKTRVLTRAECGFGAQTGASPFLTEVVHPTCPVAMIRNDAGNSFTLVLHWPIADVPISQLSDLTWAKVLLR